MIFFTLVIKLTTIFYFTILNTHTVGDPKILQVQSALNRALIERTLELRLSEKYGRRWASLNMREAEPLVQWNKTRSSFDSGTNFQPSNTDNSTNTSTSNNNNNNSSSRNIPKDDSIEKLKKSQHLLESLKESSGSSNSSVSASSAASASVDKKSSPAVPISSTTALTPSSSSSSSAGSPPTFISTSPVPLLSQRKKRGGLSSKHLNIKDGHSYSRVDRQLSIQSVTHKSEFITSIEKSGKFVCHNCCTEDGLGPELNSSRYTYQDYFNEKAWANIDNLEPPIHNPEAKKLRYPLFHFIFKFYFVDFIL